MNLTAYSHNRFIESLKHWHVDSRDMVEPIYNYLVYGFEPGSFFTSLFANDFLNAMCRSHPANSLEELKDISRWVLNACPHEAWGSYGRVKEWINLDHQQRRRLLEEWKLIYTEQEEIMMALQNKPQVEPHLF